MADLHIIGSGGVEVGGQGIISRWLRNDFVGSGGVKVGGAGVVAFKMPGVTALPGSGGVVVAGDGVVTFIYPGVLAVVGDGGVEVGGEGVIDSVFPPVEAFVGSGGVQVGGAGVVAFTMPTKPPVLAVVGSGGVVVGGAGVVGGIQPPVLAIIGSGGVKVGEFRVPELTVLKVLFPPVLASLAITGSGGVQVGGEGVITWSAPPVYAVPGPREGAEANIKVGGAGIIAFIHPQILQVIGAGEVLVGGETEDLEPVETYVLTGVRGEPSIYSGFNFNSYARYRDQYYGAGSDGIYLLEGEDDAGKEIHSGVRIGPTNFGTEREKRLRLLRCGGKTAGAQVKVTTDSGCADYVDVAEGRAHISRDVQGRELTMEIADFEELDHLEVVPHLLVKR